MSKCEYCPQGQCEECDSIQYVKWVDDQPIRTGRIVRRLFVALIVIAVGGVSAAGFFLRAADVPAQIVWEDGE